MRHNRDGGVIQQQTLFPVEGRPVRYRWRGRRWSQGRRWTAEEVAMLGEAPDLDVAKRLGLTYKVVNSERKHRGIPIFKECRDCGSRIDMTAKRPQSLFCDACYARHEARWAAADRERERKAHEKEIAGRPPRKCAEPGCNETFPAFGKRKYCDAGSGSVSNFQTEPLPATLVGSGAKRSANESRRGPFAKGSRPPGSSGTSTSVPGMAFQSKMKPR